MSGRRTTNNSTSSDSKLQLTGAIGATWIGAGVSLYIFYRTTSTTEHSPMPPQPQAQPSTFPFAGRVVDAASFSPIPNAGVLLVGDIASPDMQTNGNGVFSGQVESKDGSVIVVVSANGYSTYSDREISTDSPLPVQLDPVPTKRVRFIDHIERLNGK